MAITASFPNSSATSREAATLARPATDLFFRQIVEGSPQGIMLRGCERIDYANAAYARIFGYDDPDEIIGQPWRRLVRAEDAALHQSRGEACLRGETVPPLAAWQGLRKDGTRVWLKSTACPCVWQEKPALLAFLTDITELKQAEEQLQQAQRMAAVGRLAGGIAHDFNNQLTVILGYSDMALSAPQLSDLHRCAIEQVRNAGDRASALALQLLALSRKNDLPAARSKR